LSPLATITPEESATGIVKILFGLTPKDNAKFLSVRQSIFNAYFSMMEVLILIEWMATDCKYARFISSFRNLVLLSVFRHLISDMSFLNNYYSDQFV
jgi:predicted amino acid-binding ACT domain protein